MADGSVLTRYDMASRALAEVHRVDEVKKIHDKAVALATYAKQAKDSMLIAHATEIRLRAEIRAGELLIEMAERKERQKPGDADGNRRLPSVPKLSDLGVSKMQSSRWQRLAKLEPDEQEVKIATVVRKAQAAVDPATPKPKHSGKRRPVSTTEPPAPEQQKPEEPEEEAQGPADPENLRVAYMLRVDTAIRFATEDVPYLLKRSLPITNEIIAMAHRVIAEWTVLVQQMEKSG